MQSWPLVDVKDDGIRPAGSPDECFYCCQKVGQLHKLDCVIVEKLIEMRVLVSRIEASEKQMGEVQAQEARAIESYRSGALTEEIEAEVIEGLKPHMPELFTGEVSCRTWRPFLPSAR